MIQRDLDACDAFASTSGDSCSSCDCESSGVSFYDAALTRFYQGCALLCMQRDLENLQDDIRNTLHLE